MNAGPFAPLLEEFNRHWAAQAPELEMEAAGPDFAVPDDHPLQGELTALCRGEAASLPYFMNKEVAWCTVAPNADGLRTAVADLQAWVLPSFGGEADGDGYIRPGIGRGRLAALILVIAPEGYYRWHCPAAGYRRVLGKLASKRALEARRPPRTRPPRPSLYELRAQFATALLVGDRERAEAVVELLDSLQLDSATNTQFMRVRLWHHFHEFERIRDHPQLGPLLAQALPPRVQGWLDEALGRDRPVAVPEIEVASPAPIAPVPEPAPPTMPPGEPVAASSWSTWFQAVRRGDRAAASFFLSEREFTMPAAGEISVLVEGVEELYLDDTLLQRERPLVLEGVAVLLEDFVREPEFPRAAFGDFYLALLRLWSALHSGTSAGREHGHVLLELAGAALQLNRPPGEVRGLLERWWSARPVPAQLPFVLEAIDLLRREVPDPEASANLWLGAADVIQRAAESLTSTDRALWRRAGQQLGFDAGTIAQFLPAETAEIASAPDLLAEAGLRHIAIVCMREAQAKEAAALIHERTGADVTLVLGKTAGAETTQACRADIVLFVWLATSHAVFRAFDGVDRKRISYVQGTGAASIVRSLERWALVNTGSL